MHAISDESTSNLIQCIRAVWFGILEIFCNCIYLHMHLIHQHNIIQFSVHTQLVFLTPILIYKRIFPSPPHTVPVKSFDWYCISQWSLHPTKLLWHDPCFTAPSGECLILQQTYQFSNLRKCYAICVENVARDVAQQILCVLTNF